MANFIAEHYDYIKAIHVIFVISWMAGLFYLPRLYVYHVHATKEQAKLLEVMERKLLRVIINPAMILTFLFGGMLLYFYIHNGLLKNAHWLHAKLGLVLLMAGFHGFLAAIRKKFMRGENTRSEKFYRILNEVPVLLMIFIVILVVVKPVL